jgi:hypothetical protein
MAEANLWGESDLKTLEPDTLSCVPYASVLEIAVIRAHLSQLAPYEKG